MKRCRACHNFMVEPVKKGTYIDRLYACFDCELYWDGQKWRTYEEVSKIAKKMD